MKKNDRRYISLETAKIEFTDKKDYLEKESDEIKPMNMSDDKESDERY